MRDKNANIEYSICIASYNRPVLLDQLLKSIENQRDINHSTFEIVIVDNDSQMSAKAIFEKYQSISIYRCKYFNEPVKNISLARNLAVKKADGNFIIFIDDDETACITWLNSLTSTRKHFDADIVCGRVKPSFQNIPAKYKKECYIYNRRIKQIDGRILPAGIANTLIRKSILQQIEGPFNPDFGRTGGEDSMLFYEIQKYKPKMAFCNKAVVKERICDDRTTTRWLMKRAFRGGNTYARVRLTGADKKMLFRVGMGFKAICKAEGAAIMAALNVFNPVASFNWLLKSVSNLGKLALALGVTKIEY